MALMEGIGTRTTANHTCSFGSADNSYAFRMMKLFKKSGINFISCPTENVYLEGRQDTYPKRRGITRVKELYDKAKNGDTKAFSLLYAGVCKEMYKFALYMMKHTEDAEDAVSETVISAFENIAKLKNESSFKSWIFTILGNQCRKMLGKRENHASEEETPEAGHEPDYEQHFDVKEAFARLEEEERMILSYSVFAGYGSEEIAQMLEMNAATVRSKKSRALGKMRKMLEAG